MSYRVSPLFLALAFASSAGCNATLAAATGGSGASGGAAGAAGAGGAGASGTGGDIVLGGFGGAGTGGSSGTECNSGPNDDADGDGFTSAMGDCNDCDKNVSPGAVEVLAQPDAMGNVPPPADEDCNGMVDDVAPPCDSGLALDSFDPLDGARAIDLCQQATGSSWGVLEAAYVRSDGTTPATPTRGVGLLATFGQGSAPQKGATMLALSTGVARDANDPNACGYQTCQHTTGDGDVSSNANPGLAPGGGFCDQGAVCYPVDAPGCSTTDGEVNDDIGLRVKLRAPTNATGFRYKFRFFSFEFPEYVCSSFNDQYVALMSPPPAGAVNSNISFDAAGNAVSVNVGFFDVCDPAAAVNYAQFGSNKPLPNPFCPAGPGDLVGTGFAEWGFGADDAGATVWLQSTAPVVGGAEFELLFTIWDTSDFAYDSTVLVDGFEWIANGGTVSVVTEPPPN